MNKLEHNIEIESYVKGWRERIKKEQQQISKRFNDARKTIPIIIEILKKYNIEQIILFGSICDRDHFSQRSDIDIAVVGLENRFFFKVYGELMMKVDFEIDLKPFEQLDQLIKNQIFENGEIIYVREK